MHKHSNNYCYSIHINCTIVLFQLTVCNIVHTRIHASGWRYIPDLWLPVDKQIYWVTLRGYFALLIVVLYITCVQMLVIQ